MTGTLSQLISLTAFGNYYLKNAEIPLAFFSTNSSFKFCNRVDFMVFNKSLFYLAPKEKVIANNVTEWFKYLKADGCKCLRLYFESSKDQSLAKDYQLAGFVGGGGSWLIEAIYDKYSNYWANRWQVTNKDAIDHKIWSVNYGMVVRKQRISNIQIDNQKTKENLRQILTEIADFAFKKDLGSWGEIFERAKTILESPSPEQEYSQNDLIPLDSYSLIAKQIIFSAGAAWFFGGMGSWNDMGFNTEDDNKTYNRLSEHLYSSINKAIIAGINTY